MKKTFFFVFLIFLGMMTTTVVYGDSYTCSDVMTGTPTASQTQTCSSGTLQNGSAGELCPFSQTPCVQQTSTPQCPSGYSWNGTSCAGTTTQTVMSNPQFNGGSGGDGNGIYGIDIQGNGLYRYDGQYDGCGGAQWNSYTASFSGFSMSGSIGWFCTYPILVGEGNVIQGFDINRTCNSWTKYSCGRNTCTECSSWSYSESSVGSISVSGANVTGTTYPSTAIYTGGNQIWGNYSYQYPAPSPTCPSGYVFNSSNGECETETCKREYVCTGSGRNRSCGYQTVCYWTGNTTAATYPPCMTGFHNSGSECVENGGGVLTFNPVSVITTVSTTASATCPSGTTLVNGECVSPWNCPVSGNGGDSATCIEPSGSSTYYCSPYSCYTDSSGTNVSTTPVNATMPPTQTNNGAVTDSGCDGSVYLFPGTAMQCRSGGEQTAWQDCCNASTYLFGMLKCTTQEESVAKDLQYDTQYGANGYNNPNSYGGSGDAQYVGSYCSDKFFGLCLENMKVYCVFHSLLGLIIQEQGRAQLGIGFGSPQNPDCSGLTPTQFQELNFSNFDFTEYVTVLENKIKAGVINTNTLNQIQNYTTTITNQISNYENELSGVNP